MSEEREIKVRVDFAVNNSIKREAQEAAREMEAVNKALEEQRRLTQQLSLKIQPPVYGPFPAPVPSPTLQVNVPPPRQASLMPHRTDEELAEAQRNYDKQTAELRERLRRQNNPTEEELREAADRRSRQASVVYPTTKARSIAEMLAHSPEEKLPERPHYEPDTIGQKIGVAVARVFASPIVAARYLRGDKEYSEQRQQGLITHYEKFMPPEQAALKGTLVALREETSRTGQLIVQTFNQVGASIGNAVQAASPDAWRTLTMSMDMVRAEVGIMFIPEIVALSGELQNAAHWVRGFDDTTRKHIVTYTVWGAGVAGVIGVTSRLWPIIQTGSYVMGVFAGVVWTAGRALVAFAFAHPYITATAEVTPAMAVM